MCLMLSAAAMWVVLLLISIPASFAGQCPPPGFDSVKNFNISAYISSEWYVQEQMVNAYQREYQLYCVRALYVPVNPKDLNQGLQVINSAREGSTSGRVIGSTGSNTTSNSLFETSFGISAFPATPLSTDGSSSSPTGASKLAVGPSFLAGAYQLGLKKVYGPYWVVAVGNSADPKLGYDWAIISGGPPATSTSGGCATGPANPTVFNINNSGLWLFSRQPVDPTATATMRKVAAGLGFDLSVLKKVQQEGCMYPQQPAVVAASGSTSSQKGPLQAALSRKFIAG